MASQEQRTAVVVNDEPSQLRLISAVLERAGIRTRCYTGVEDALDALLAEPAADLIITDLHMPGIDGWQFCRLLRSPEYVRFNRVPILVVSATFSGSEAEQVSLELGADAFLAAPFAPSVLQQYAAALLDGQRPNPAPRALIVHADLDEAERLGNAFAASGYAAELAHTGGAALRMWDAHQPDVIVLHDQLSDIPVGDVLAQIKHPGGRTVAFTITSENTNREALVLARQGADGSVPEPADPARLIALCEKVRRQRALMRTEELLAERGRALRESEARWRSLFEAIPEIVVVHDEDGVIRHINQTGAEQLEWPAHELIGRRLREFEGRDAEAAAVPPERGQGRIETVYVSRSGRAIPVEVNQRRVAFEGRPAVLSVARDISARRELVRQRHDFVALLTDEIKNPLASVLGAIAPLGEVGELNDAQRDLIARMQATTSSVLTLVANYPPRTKSPSEA